MHEVFITVCAMTTFRRTLSRRSLLASAAVAAAGPARADSWPDKPVQIIVPFAPGGSGDITARLIGKYLEEKLGQPFVIEDKAGANGIVGVLAAKSAPADGYTLMLATTSTNAANVHMYKKLGYDPEKDFSVVGIIGDSGAFLVVPANTSYKTISDLIAHARKNPGKLNFGYFNASSQVPSEVLGAEARVEWQGVAYKAIGNAWTDLYAGQIQFMFVDLTAARAQVVTNKVRPLAISLPERSPLYPDVPTLAETFPGFVSTGFLAMAVRKNVPEGIKQKLNTLINEAVFSPEIHKRLIEEFALAPQRLDLVQCAAKDREERIKWADYVRIAQITPQ